MWLAEVHDGKLQRVENGRTRDQLVAYLLAVASDEPELVVGLDFAFSAPAWFLNQLEVDAPGLWAIAAEKGEDWLLECAPPFWGRGKTKRPELPEHFRVADRLVVGGVSPKSVFQIGGAGARGTGSVRGWPFLPRLRSAGFAIWPFDSLAFPLLVEIYPRLLTGPVVKSSVEARNLYVAAHYPNLSDQERELVTSSEDAFDAGVSALVMAEHAEEFASLQPVTDAIALMEEVIWHPRTRAMGEPNTPDSDGVRPAFRRTDSPPRRLAGRLGSILTRYAERP
jgi:hypothetical protein